MAGTTYTFALVIFALLLTFVAAQTPTVNHGFISTIDRQTSPYFLSFRTDLSSLASLTGVTAEYSIGITAGSTEILTWKSITSLATTNTITEVFTFAIPADYTVFVNLKVNDNGVINTYSSASLKVGDRLTSDPSCGAIFNPIGTSTETVPEPDITIEYDNNAQLFKFNIVAKYLLQGYTWVIDFAPFLADSTKGVKGLAATNCENRQTGDLSSRPFPAFWNAAPSADYTGALNNANYLSYLVGSSSPKWTTIANVGCDKVRYTTSGAGFSFNDLLACRQADGTTPSIVRTIVGGQIHYNGTLYVTAVKPVDPLDETKGFQTTRFTKPFFVSFSVSSTSIGSGTDSNIFGFSISSLNLAADGNLNLVLATNTFDSNFYLTTPVIDLQPTGVSLVAGAAPGNAQQQSWSFATTTPKVDYTGSYAISFTRTNGQGQSVSVTAQFILRLSINNGYNNIGLKLPTSLSFWGDSTYAGTTKSAYTSLDTIYVKSTVTISNTQDQNSYANTIYNVWLCYTVDGSTPAWDPDNNQLGCTAQTWNTRVVSQLVINGAEVTSGALESQFQTAIVNAIGSQTSNNAGVSFKAAPLATLKSGQFFVQIESRINLPAKKRGIRALFEEQASSTEIQNFNVEIATQASQTPFVSTAPIAKLSVAIAFFVGFLLL